MLGIKPEHLGQEEGVLNIVLWFPEILIFVSGFLVPQILIQLRGFGIIAGLRKSEFKSY